MSDQEAVEVEETNDNDAPVESGSESESGEGNGLEGKPPTPHRLTLVFRI